MTDIPAAADIAAIDISLPLEYYRGRRRPSSVECIFSCHYPFASPPLLFIPRHGDIIQEEFNMVKKILRILLYYAACDIFSLFICLTLASSGSTPMRILCTLLTTGVLASLMLSMGIKLEKEDKPDSAGAAFRNAALYKRAGCIISEISWIVLLINHFSGGNYYRIHKLVNGWFLPLYNIMDPGISSAPLTGFQLFLMLLLADVPGWLIMGGYIYSCRKSE